MKVRNGVVVTSLFMLVLGTFACSSGGDTAMPVVADTAGDGASGENPYGAGLIDPPLPDEPILTVTTAEKSVTYSLNQLRELEATSAEVFEPFVLVNTSFTGVALSVLFNAAGIPDEAKVETLAINEYVYANTAESFTESQGILAYEENGADISVDRGGPIRLIFPDGTTLSKNLDAWNWSLEAISVG